MRAHIAFQGPTPARLDCNRPVRGRRRHAAEGSLRAVIIERHERVVEEDAELVPLVFGIADGGGDRAFRRMPLLLRIEPSAHSRADRTGALFPKLQLCGPCQRRGTPNGYFLNARGAPLTRDGFEYVLESIQPIGQGHGVDRRFGLAISASCLPPA